MFNTIFLVVGRSGSGKTTLTTRLEEEYGMKAIQSYTTRPPRYDGEQGHIFVGNYQYWNKCHPHETLVGFTVYRGYEYWATASQAEESDLYVIDPAGIEFFQQNYSGSKQVKVIYIDADLGERFARMRRRGDSFGAIIKRLINDRKWFDGWRDKADFVVENHDAEIAYQRLLKYIKKHQISIP